MRKYAMQEKIEKTAKTKKKRACEKTSYEIRKRWNKANYTRIVADVKKEDAARFKEKCIAEGVSQAAILKEAIYKFLDK